VPEHAVRTTAKVGLFEQTGTFQNLTLTAHYSLSYSAFLSNGVIAPRSIAAQGADYGDVLVDVLSHYLILLSNAKRA
jgi:hypothetical protein